MQLKGDLTHTGLSLETHHVVPIRVPTPGTQRSVGKGSGARDTETEQEERRSQNIKDASVCHVQPVVLSSGGGPH